MFFDDPENLQEFFKPMVGDVLIRPETGSLFTADICMKKLQHVALFSLSSNSLTVFKDEQADLGVIKCVGINIIIF